MSELREYLRQVLKGTYLRGPEKAVWTEEMEGHLADAARVFEEQGQTREAAHQLAIQSFGTVKGLRRQIIRDTFGISPRWFLATSAVSFAALICSLFVNMATSLYDPVRHISLPAPHYAIVLKHFLPTMSFSFWDACTVTFFMMIYTRKRIDRAALWVSLCPYVALWALNHIAHSYRLSTLFYGSWRTSPFGTTTMTGCLLLLALSVVMFIWTCNRAVSLTPILVSLSFLLWPITRDTVQSALYNWTDNPMFWGHFFPDGTTLIRLGITIVLHLVVVALFMLTSKVFEQWRVQKPRQA